MGMHHNQHLTHICQVWFTCAAHKDRCWDPVLPCQARRTPPTLSTMPPPPTHTHTHVLL